MLIIKQNGDYKLMFATIAILTLMKHKTLWEFLSNRLQLLRIA